MSAKIEAFFHEATNTVCYVVSDPATKHAAIVDSCLDFDMAAARTQTTHADQVLAYIAANDLTVDWILETHVHADHLSAAPYLRDQIGGREAAAAARKLREQETGQLVHAPLGSQRTPSSNASTSSPIGSSAQASEASSSS